MRLYHTKSGILMRSDEDFFLLTDTNWDDFINDDLLHHKCHSNCISKNLIPNGDIFLGTDQLLKPIVSQEIWASGVTYYNSKMARQEESKDSGGADFYAKVYVAERPELFYKSNAERAAGHHERIRIRRDSEWNVPEPELTLCITSSGKIVGYTIGNDVSSRSIEGENPLYLPQAKVYDKSAALGPGILVTKEALPLDTKIRMTIDRASKLIFEGSTKVNQIVRKFEDLVQYLYRDLTFTNGCFLMTGTGIVPGTEFSLQSGDKVTIEIESIGRLVNVVE